MKKLSNKLEKAAKQERGTGLKVFAAFCAGLAIGLLVSPIKNGIGNNSGNTTHYHWDGKTPDDECACCGEDEEESA